MSTTNEYLWDRLQSEWRSVAYLVNDRHEGTCRTALNAMVRAGYAQRRGKRGGLTEYRKHPDKAGVGVTAMVRAVNVMLGHSVNGHAAPEPLARILLTLEVPGGETVTLDMTQARAVYEELKAVFG